MISSIILFILIGIEGFFLFGSFNLFLILVANIIPDFIYQICTGKENIPDFLFILFSVIAKIIFILYFSQPVEYEHIALTNYRNITKGVFALGYIMDLATFIYWILFIIEQKNKK